MRHGVDQISESMNVGSLVADPRTARQGLASDSRQLGVPEFSSIRASGLLSHSADGQRCLLRLGPDLFAGLGLGA
jgi:hypothetical protein